MCEMEGGVVPEGSRCEGIPYCEHGCRLERTEKTELLRGEGGVRSVRGRLRVSAGCVYEVGSVPYCTCNVTLVEEVECVVFCIWAPGAVGFVWGYFGNWSTDR